MKQLQNNFTSPEQSTRLLDLGLPADSADCYYLREHTDKVYLFQNQKESDNCISKIRLRLGLGHAMPCWSVGRLIEILCICKKGEEVSFYTWTDKVDLVEWIIYKIEVAEPNFSKLED